MKNTTNKHLIKNSIFTILFILLLLLTSFLDPFTSNAGTSTYITKNKTFTINGCEDGSNIRFFCQLDKNNALSGIIGSTVYATSCDLDRGKSAITVTWQTPISADSNPLGGSFKCSYRSSTNIWTIQMIDVNCHQYTPYIICNAGTKTGYTSTSVSEIAGTNAGVSTDGTYSPVKLTAESMGSNFFKVYIGAGFADNGFTFNWVPNTYYVTYDGNGATSGVPAKQSFVFNSGTKLSTTKPVRTGYTFVHWTGSGNIIGNSFAPGAAIPKDWGSFTLKAVWTPNVYTIILNNQSGTGVWRAVCVKYNTGKYTTTACKDSLPQVTIPTRTGYTFGGYYTGPNGTGNAINQ